MYIDTMGRINLQTLELIHSPITGQLVCGVCCVASRMLGHVLVAMTTEAECITLSLR